MVQARMVFLDYNGGGVVGKHVCVRQRLTERQWLGLFQWRMFSGVDWKPFFYEGMGNQVDGEEWGVQIGAGGGQLSSSWNFIFALTDSCPLR